MRVLVLSRDPGGANAVLPLVPALSARGHQVLLYGKDAALARYRQASLQGTDVMTVLGEVSLASVRALLAQAAPDLVLTGTSADDLTEKYLWRACDDLGIPSLAVVDQWTNYGVRFSRYGVGELAAYQADKSHPFLPSRIGAPDNFAREEMVADGLPAERIVVCGQPYFETVLANRETGAVPGRPAKSAEFEVVFASEPITTVYGAGAGHWGYTERSILASLLNALERSAAEAGRKVTLTVRPHPKEGSEHFADIVAGSRRVRCRFDSESLPWPLMNRAHLVCGMSSMFLLESVLLGRPTLSIQIGLRREDPFVLSRRGILPALLSEEALERALREIVIDGGRRAPRFQVIDNPVQRVVAELERLSRRNGRQR